MPVRLARLVVLTAVCLSVPCAAQAPSVVDAQKLTTEAGALVAQAATAQRGIETLKQALDLWRKAGDRSGEARALYLIGRGFSRLSRQEDAIAHYEQALAIQRELKDRAEEGRLLVDVGVSLNALSRYQEAIERLNGGLAVARDTGNREDEAIALSALGNAYQLLNKYDKALECLQPAVAAAHDVGNKSAEANALNTLANVYRSMRRYDEATRGYHEALDIYRALGDRSSEAGTLSNLAIVQNLQNRNEEAIALYEQALAIHRELKNRNGEGIVLNNLGQSYIRLRRYEKAIENLEPALAIAREVKRRTGEANSLTGLADAYSALADPERAIGYYEQALAIHREVKSRGSEATVLVTLSVLHNQLGHYERAIQSLGDALAVSREMKDAELESSVLSTLATAYLYLGRSGEAIANYEQALVLARAAKDRAGEGIILNSLGQVFVTLDRNDEAQQSLQQGLAIARELKRPTSQTYALNSLGELYGRMGQPERALQMHTEALAIAREANYRPGEGLALARLGDTYRTLGQLDKAAEHLQPALTLARAIQDPEAETMTLTGLARVARDRGDLATARGFAEHTLSRIESVRSQMFGRESRTAYFASAQSASELFADILLRLHKTAPSAGYDALALDSSERHRARGLLELLTEAGMDVREGVDPALVHQERAIETQLNALSSSRMQAQLRTHTPEALASLDNDIARLEQERERVGVEIRQTSPRYAALVHPEPLTTRDIQKDLLDEETLLIEFLLGEERSYVWAVSTKSVTTAELPKRADIEAAARRVLELLTARKTATIADGQARAAAERDLRAAGRRLSQMVLGPIAHELGDRRLVVVPDGALHYVPFAMLPSPTPSTGGRGQRNGVEPLIVRHEIVTLPSASTLAIIRKDLVQRAPVRDGIAVIADPVFSANDERLKSAVRTATTALPTAAGIEQTRLLVHLAGTPVAKGTLLIIPRLPFTRNEAERILRGSSDSSNFKAVDFNASKAIVTSGRLATYRYVHFATHGYLDAERPGFSSLVLSTVDDKGQPQDGFLRVNDIYNLKLPADVVVLSACQSGLGKEIKGEGLVGLTRGFMYAGAARIVVSLWNVSDEGTAELMSRFYEKMIGGHQRPAAALRAAQIEMSRQPRWESPYYWAAFTLQGEWR